MDIPFAPFAPFEALTDRAPGHRDDAAASLGDLLRSRALDADTARLIVGRLVGLAVNEPVTAVRESALNAISDTSPHHALPFSLVEPLIPAMPTMGPELLLHTLDILGTTHDRSALPTIEAHLGHPDQEVRDGARLAVSEINWA
ncbi:hypothetical protein ACIA8O_30505 [Kitasatospora sp. NPDC051853]|uniref:hypothetical protein n=1 Tax=Kitasatospora sp. NPDC051853 TaxID=3364058 RepID=UPI0037BBD810